MKRTITIEPNVGKKSRTMTTVIEKTMRKRRKRENPRFDFGSGIAERKVMLSESSSGVGTMSYTPVSQLLNGISNGNGFNQRIGNKIRMTSVQLRLGIMCPVNNLGTWEALGVGPRVARILVVYDRQPNGAAPTLPQVLDQSGSSVYWPYSNRNVNYMDRFVVLIDKTLMIFAGGPNSATFDEYVKIGLPVQFLSSGAAITDIQEGALYLFQVDTNGSAANPTYIDWRAKVLFTDE